MVLVMMVFTQRDDCCYHACKEVGGKSSIGRGVDGGVEIVGLKDIGGKERIDKLRSVFLRRGKAQCTVQGGALEAVVVAVRAVRGGLKAAAMIRVR